MAAGDVKIAYSTSANMTVTNLNGLTGSATWVYGWESAAIDNSTTLYEDFLLTAKLTSSTANSTGGEYRLYVVGQLDDSNWPDVFDGTESVETITDTEIRDAICRLGAITAVDTTAARAYYLGPISVAAMYGGVCPSRFVCFITGNAALSTNAQLSTSGNQVTYKGVYRTVAQS